MRIYRADEYIKPGHTVGIFLSKDGGEEQVHGHDFIEIVYITSGRAVHEIDGATYDVARGDVLFINHGSRHAFRSEDGFSYVNICFSILDVADARLTQENAMALLSLSAFHTLRGDKNAGKISLSSRERMQMDWLTEQMLSEYKEEKPHDVELLDGYFRIVLTIMLRKTEAETVEVERDVWNELRAYIDENPAEELTLGSLSKKCFYNPSYFSRAFKQKHGMTLTEYVGKRRVQEAVRLMEKEGASTSEIVERCGYSDRNAFSHAFVRYMGMSVSEYREKVKKQGK